MSSPADSTDCLHLTLLPFCRLAIEQRLLARRTRLGADRRFLDLRQRTEA